MVIVSTLSLSVSVAAKLSVSAARPRSISPELCPSPVLVLGSSSVSPSFPHPSLPLSLRAFLFLALQNCVTFSFSFFPAHWWRDVMNGLLLSYLPICPRSLFFSPGLHYSLLTWGLCCHSAPVKQASTESHQGNTKTCLGPIYFSLKSSFFFTFWRNLGAGWLLTKQ